MKPDGSLTAPKPQPRLLAQSRQWHKWGGLIAGIFLIVAGASGIVLNYKKPIFTALGLEVEPPLNRASTGPRARLMTGTGLTAGRITLDGALAIARAEWGDVPLERIELKAERGEWTYKLKQKDGDELWIGAADGSYFVKGEYERIGKPAPDGRPARRTDWGRIILDLHTGKIGGAAGKAIMSCAALLLLLLTLSGVYLWLKPLLIRRHNMPPSNGMPG
jgi:hypothetical protein